MSLFQFHHKKAPPEFPEEFNKPLNCKGVLVIGLPATDVRPKAFYQVETAETRLSVRSKFNSAKPIALKAPAHADPSNSRRFPCWNGLTSQALKLPDTTKTFTFIMEFHPQIHTNPTKLYLCWFPKFPQILIEWKIHEICDKMGANWEEREFSKELTTTIAFAIRKKLIVDFWCCYTTKIHSIWMQKLFTKGTT